MGAVKNDAWNKIEELYYLGYEPSDIAKILDADIDFVNAVLNKEESDE